MKTIIGCIGLLFLSLLVKATDNKMGIDLYQSGMYFASKVYFSKNMEGLTPDQKAEAYYYMGENYMMLGHADSARMCYEKGIELQAEYPYNHIGIGKLRLRENVKEGEDIFKDALSVKGYKKDAGVQLAMARAYLYVGMKDKVLECIEQAKKFDEKSGLPYLLEGDILAAEKKIGDAGAKYDMAIYFSPECIGAYMKLAQLYMSANQTLSMEKLNHVKEMDPDFIGVYCKLGELYEMMGMYSEAEKNYSKYIESGYYDPAQLLRYAGILYFNKQYEEMLPIITPVLDMRPNDMVAKRLYAYCMSKLRVDTTSIEAIKHFIETTPEENCIAQDFLCYAEQLVTGKKYDDALVYYEKALVKDETKKELYKEMMDICVRSGALDKAIRYYRRYEELVGKTEPEDILRLGKSFYNSACRDSIVETQKKELAVADSLFGILSTQVPQSYVSYFWRARVNSMLDPETTQGLAKPYYEKVVEIAVEQPDRYKRELIESYKYLGYYYYLQADAITTKNNGNPVPAKEMYDLAKSYFSKVITIDPTDQIAGQALEQIK